ncbi:unnamed protein product [Haemonchus placei]|uniref:Uncharacterized protein n=1 Tax=Haemonchus placei TaxID=6290 RepID=A0A3P7WLK4_HAEPC|nr:unnamed protein product [Haemonchus placei]
MNVYGVEEVPRASPIRSTAQREIRRAPVYKPAGAAPPRARGFRRTSTGVRRAPHTASSSPSPQKAKIVRPPLSVPVIPMPSMVPMNVQFVTFPPMMSIPTLPTFATIPMPTLPTLTMPPSFQRLMGITTAAPPRKSKHEARKTKPEKFINEEEEGVEERPLRPPIDSLKSLSPVSSRLPKFVNPRKMSVVSPETNADWIVPF